MEHLNLRLKVSSISECVDAVFVFFVHTPTALAVIWS